MKKFFAVLFVLFAVSTANAIATFEVTSTSPFATVEGSLPWAIQQSNAATEEVRIHFSIPTTESGYITEEGMAYWRIALLSPLNLTHNQIYLYGSSQEVRGIKNPAGPQIELTRDQSASLEALIKITGTNLCTVEGLILNNSNGYGAYIRGSNRCRIINCFIGTTASGEAAKPNTLAGIYIYGGDQNRVGGLGSKEGNVISGNLSHGIELFTSTNTTIQNNKIGTNTNESVAVANSQYGIYFHDASHDSTIEANTIINNGSASYPYGVLLDGGDTKYNSLLRNKITSAFNQAVRLTNSANGEIAPPIISTIESYSVPNRSYVSGTAASLSHVEIFLAQTQEVVSEGGGKQFLGSTEADSSGAWFTYVSTSLEGLRVTALQTDRNKNTSQFAVNKGTISLVNESRPDIEIASLESRADYVGYNVINGTGFMQSREKTNVAGQKLIYYFRANNTGTTTESLTITGTSGNTSWEVKYYDATIEGTEITGTVTAAGWSTISLTPNQSIEARVEMTAKVSALMLKSINITATSSLNTARKDVVVVTSTATLPPQSIDHFDFTIPSNIYANTNFFTTIEAKDVSGNITTDVQSNVALAVDYGTVSPETISATAFATNGKWEGSMKLSKAGKRTVSARSGAVFSSCDIITYNASTEFNDAALGVTVVVPQGALSSEASIEISELQDLPGSPPTGTWQAGKIIQLTSTATTSFETPIRITLPLYTGTTNPAAYYWTGSAWSKSGITPISESSNSITFTSSHLTVFVPFADAAAAQFSFGPSPFSPARDGNATFWYWLINQKDTSILVFDMAGNLIYKKVFTSGSSGAKGGLNTVSWDGKNNFGETVKNGAYQYRIVQSGAAIGRGKFIVFQE